MDDILDLDVVAYHEAGHGVAAILLSECLGQTLKLISILPKEVQDGLELGRTIRSEVAADRHSLVYYGPSESHRPSDRKWYRRHFQAQVIVVCMGVRAEALRCGDRRARFSNQDLNRLFYNMSRIDPRFVSGDGVMNGGLTTRGRNYFSHLEGVAISLTHTYWREISTVALALRRKGRLSGASVKQILEQH